VCREADESNAEAADGMEKTGFMDASILRHPRHSFQPVIYNLLV
jgi:hypothetical protein